jgi:hypothetical protein
MSAKWVLPSLGVLLSSIAIFWQVTLASGGQKKPSQDPASSTNPGLQTKNQSFVPKPVVLTPRQYQKLLDEVEQLRSEIRLNQTEAGLGRHQGRTVSAIVERSLVQATLDRSGLQRFRARFWLGKIVQRLIVIQFPFALSRTDVHVQLADKSLSLRLLDQSGTSGTVAGRWQLEVEPDLYPTGALLDIRYQFHSERQAVRGANALELVPPSLEDALVVGRARWQVVLPTESLAIHVGGGAVMERQWSWRKWLFAPLPAVPARELDHWISHSDSAASEDDFGPEVVCWQPFLAPLPLLVVPQRLWLLACSLSFLVLTFGIAQSLRRPILSWPLAAFASILLCAVAVYLPDMLPMLIYGCQPGVFVISAVWMGHGILRLAQRKKISWLSSFNRATQGSVLGMMEGLNSPTPVANGPPAQFGNSATSQASTGKADLRSNSRE